MAVEMPSSAQQNDIGISSTINSVSGSGADVATLIGTLGGAMSGILESGCVFFICTVGAVGDFGGRSGSTVILAVSFFGTLTAIRAVSFFGSDRGSAIEAAANPGETPIDLGAGGGTGACADGGRGIGGRAGRLIRVVSRDSPPAGCGFGGNAMRTVSFLGSVESAMKRGNRSKRDCSRIARLSLVNFGFPRACHPEQVEGSRRESFKITSTGSFGSASLRSG